MSKQNIDKGKVNTAILFLSWFTLTMSEDKGHVAKILMKFIRLWWVNSKWETYPSLLQETVFVYVGILNKLSNNWD